MADSNNAKSSKIRDIIQTALLIIVLLFIIVDRIIVPQVAVVKSTETAAQAMARLTDALALENRLSVLETNYKNIDRKLDNIANKLDAHMEKGK